MNTLGKALRLSLFGASHDSCVGCILDGLPAGYAIHENDIISDLSLRKPAAGIGTARHEDDIPAITGVSEGCTTGSPVVITFANTDVKSSDYDSEARIPRPGHADYPAFCKYGASFDTRGGGMFSGRMTAPLVAAGGLLRGLLAASGIYVGSYLTQVGKICDGGCYTPDEIFRVSRTNPLRAMSAELEMQMRAEILAAKSDGDSVGGAVRCVASGLPTGLGEPFFDSLDGELAHAVFSVPGIKGVSFGEGFSAAGLRGSENNDWYSTLSDGRIHPDSNHAGGVLGGMADGAPLVMDAVFKPTPSISRLQHSVNLITLEDAEISVRGRHDPCIAPRGAIVIEAVTIFTIADLLFRGGFICRR